LARASRDRRSPPFLFAFLRRTAPCMKRELPVGVREKASPVEGALAMEYGQRCLKWRPTGAMHIRLRTGPQVSSISTVCRAYAAQNSADNPKPIKTAFAISASLCAGANEGKEKEVTSTRQMRLARRKQLAFVLVHWATGERLGMGRSHECHAGPPNP